MSSRGSTFVEYGTLIAIIVAALLSMQVYLKRGFSGKLRAAADSVGAPYAPKETTSNFTLRGRSDTTTESKVIKDKALGDGTKADVMVTTSTINTNTTQRTGTETVGVLKADIWE